MIVPLLLHLAATPPAAPLPAAVMPSAPVAANPREDGARPAPEVPGKPTQVGTAQKIVGDPHLLGDWLGMRKAASAAGITPTLQYVGVGLANLTGGDRRDATIAHQLAFGATLDLARLVSLPGTMQLTISHREGPHIVAKAGLAMQLSPQETFGRGELWRVSQAWYRLRRGPVEAKVGRMTLSEDYSVLRCDFASLYLCGGHNGQVAPSIWYNFPVSSWGARIRYSHRDAGFVQAGLYQVNRNDIDATRDLFVGWRGGRGVNLPVEVTLTPKLAGGTLPGAYRIGGWISNAADADVVFGRTGGLRALTGGAPLLHRGQTGWYAAARQQLVAARPDGGGGLSAFAAASFFTRRTATLERIVGLGMNWSGPLRMRPQDEIGFGLGNARRNRRLGEVQRQLRAIGASDAPVRGNEWLVEGYYGIAVAPGLVLRPDVQLAISPGGTRQRHPVLLTGFKTVATF